MKKKRNIQSRLFILPLIVLSFLLVSVGLFLNSYAFTEPVQSVFFSSKALSYEEKAPGSIGITKSAEWTEKGSARITFDLDTIMDVNSRNTDLIFVLDASRFMAGEWGQVLKQSLKELSSALLSNPENRLSLITFGEEGNILTDFTNDSEEFSLLIDSIVFQNIGRSYYQGLLKVDEVLKEYQPVEGKDCIVYFIAGGVPIGDHPNQVGEYHYLKSRYPYLTIRGIPYLWSSEASDSNGEFFNRFHEISDEQFPVDKDTIRDELLRLMMNPIAYEELVVTDFINTEYFEVEDVSDIKASSGDVKIEGEIVSWDLSKIQSGAHETLTIDVEVKDKNNIKKGYYATNQKENLSYRIEGTEETIESLESPVLLSHYNVSYDANPPTGCNLSDIPASFSALVYDTIEIDSRRLVCDGYQFAGWKVVSEKAWQMNDDYFMMPEEDVILRAEWSKLSIGKSMDGEIFTVYPPIIQSVEYAGNDKIWKYKSSATRIVFQNEIQNINNQKASYDISQEGNGSVIARIVPNVGSSNTYTIYIQGEGGVIANENSANLFDSFSVLESIEGLEYFDTSNATNMDGMFAKCPKLKSLDISSFDTSNVEIMTFMFLRNTSLTDLNLSGLDTSKVTNMRWMFRECSALESLDISSFDTSNVTNMSYMFYQCKLLESLDLSHFDTSNVTDMSYMFQECKVITNFNLNNFDTSKVTNMAYMFNNCNELTTLDLSSFDTSSVTNMMYMFYQCKLLESLDLSHFKTSNVTDMSYMFFECQSLKNLLVSGFDVRNVTNMQQMFRNCDNLLTLDLSGFVTSNVTDMQRMFEHCINLQVLDISNFDTSRVTTMDCMFQNCQSLINLNLSHLDTSNVTNMNSMFNQCFKLENLDVHNFDTTKVTNMGSMFNGCYELISLDLSSFNTTNVIDLNSMFYNCRKLVSLDIHSFETGKVTNMKNLFLECWSLTEINFDITKFKTNNVKDMSSMFSMCGKVQVLNLSNFNTAKVTTMASMFQGCSSLESLDLSNFDTSNVTTMARMFQNCSNLNDLDSHSFNTENVTNMIFMFFECRAFSSLDLRHFNVSKVSNMQNMFSGSTGLTSLILDDWNTSSLVKTDWMFNMCWKLESLDLSSFDTSNVTNMEGMFDECIALKTLNVSSFNTSKVSNMGRMFGKCRVLETLDVSNFDTSMVTSMRRMFQECYELVNIDLSGFDFTKITDTSQMFADCRRIVTTLNIRNTVIPTYTEMFTSAAIEEGSGITINYVESTSSLVDQLLTTKSENSNVVKGTLIV